MTKGITTEEKKNELEIELVARSITINNRLQQSTKSVDGFPPVLFNIYFSWSLLFYIAFRKIFVFIAGMK